MKRKDFFKTLFGVTAAAVVAPHVLVKEEKSDAEKMLDGAKAIDGYFDDEMPKYFNEVWRTWEETGVILYQV